MLAQRSPRLSNFAVRAKGSLTGQLTGRSEIPLMYAYRLRPHDPEGRLSVKWVPVLAPQLKGRNADSAVDEVMCRF